MKYDILDAPATALADTYANESRAVQNEELLQRVRLFLANCNIATLRQVNVATQGDAIVLSGAVRSFYEKQMAVKFALRVAGVLRVVDSIEVDSYVPLPRRSRGDASHYPGRVSAIAGN